jgi:serine protease AprX
MTGSRGRAVRRGAVTTVATSAVATILLGATAGAAGAAVDQSLGYDAVADKGSLYNVAEVVGAHAAYKAGYTGKGVGVALIDTGVAPVQGLTSGNVVNGPDLSFDSQDASASYTDGFGHGTHLASIIAGRDVAGTPTSYLDATRYNGIAPDSTLVNVKVGSSNGSVDVTQVIAAIDWVVQRAGDYKIKVINLSYGTDSTQDSSVDPLAYAVENAWKHGITVIAAGGDSTKNLANPASDPHVLSVGASDDAGTVTTADDTVPSWSTHGTDERSVDVVAPGVSLLGLRVPGGTADTENPTARVGDRFARASGTSMAAAVVSGEAALLYQAKPDLTPDQVKQILTGSATGLNNVSSLMEGAGTTDLRKALGTVPKTITSTDPWSTGTGSLEASRGSFHVAVEGDTTGVVSLNGEVDVFGQAWNGPTWAKASAGRTAWKDGNWRGQTLTGKSWVDAGGGKKKWPTIAWAQTSGTVTGSGEWTAKMWRDGTWSAKMWRDDAWSAKMWRDQAWG